MTDNKEASDLIKKIFIPILLILGLFGNVISIVIFTKRSLKKYSTFQYLTFLSILDLAVLYTGCGQIFLDVYFQLDIRTLNDYICKIHSFLVYFFTHLSSILLACMSIDRTVAILSRNPAKTSEFKTLIKILIFLASLAGFINFHFLVFIKLFDYELNGDASNFSNATSQKIKLCYSDLNSSYFIFLSKIFPWIDLCAYTFLPFLIMFICSIIIIQKISKKSSHLNKKTTTNKSSRKFSRNKQLIIILFVTNSLFAALVSPLVIFNATSNIRENTVPTTIVYLLAYSNHA